MKRTGLLLILLICLLSLSAAFAQAADIELLADTGITTPVSRMVWNEDGSVLTLVSADSVERIAISDPTISKSFSADAGQSNFSFSPSGLMAVLSADGRHIFLYEPDSDEKDVKTIETDYTVLSASLSNDGTQVIADSADEIRTVIYSAKDGSLLHDLDGFQTAAPVYDSTLTADGKFILWHSRGTFALQNAADGSFGETVSLWDFASSYAASPDNQTLAVGIINDDYEAGAVIFFDPQSGKERGRVILGELAPYELSYSADGSALYAVDVQNVYRIDPKAFTLQESVLVTDADSGDRISRIAASPDGKSAAALLSSGELFRIR